MALNSRKIICAAFIYYFGFRPWENVKNVHAEATPSTDMELKFVAINFRHGDRVPLFKYKTDPHANAFPEGIGELTQKGKLHAYKKGQFFRRKYNYYMSDLYLDSEILIKTTDKTRAFMTALVVLAGMYPPKDYQKWSDFETVWQPIPVYTDSPDHGNLLDHRGACPYFDSVLNTVHTQLCNDTSPNITESLLTYLSEKTGQPIDESGMRGLYDVFLCQIANDLELPEWTKPDLIERMESIILSENNVKLFYGNLNLQKFIIGPLVKEIAYNMELRTNNSSHNATKKMYLYSGHDTSLAMSLYFLHQNVSSIPGFGASLHYHLYMHKTFGYIVKIFYYDKWSSEQEEEIPIPACGDPCKIQDFVKLASDNFSGDWEVECQKVEIK